MPNLLINVVARANAQQNFVHYHILQNTIVLLNACAEPIIIVSQEQKQNQSMQTRV